MAFMNKFRRKKNQEEEQKTMATTEQEVKKADEDIEKKGPDEQSKRDRVDESVAAQEKDSGTEDSQTAKDRVDESKGEKAAEEKTEGEKGSEEKPPVWAADMLSALHEIRELLKGAEKSEETEDHHEPVGLPSADPHQLQGAPARRPYLDSFKG